MPINFVGNVEARDILTGACDVLVCDGFAGNIMLKSLEGTAGTMFSILKKEFSKSLKNKLAAAVLNAVPSRIEEEDGLQGAWRSAAVLA